MRQGHPLPFSAVRAWSLVGLAALLFMGCETEPELPPLAPVKGKVTVDDQPLTAGNVVLTPETADPNATGTFSAGQVNASGEYEIFTGGQPGAPLKKYKVVVTPATVPMAGGAPPVEINEKYRNQNSTPLTFEVTASPSAGQYDLKLTK